MSSQKPGSEAQQGSTRVRQWDRIAFEPTTRARQHLEGMDRDYVARGRRNWVAKYLNGLIETAGDPRVVLPGSPAFESHRSLLARASHQILMSDSSLADFIDTIDIRSIVSEKASRGVRMTAILLNPEMKEEDHLYEVLCLQYGNALTDQLIDSSQTSLDFFRQLSADLPNDRRSSIRVYGSNIPLLAGITIVDPEVQSAHARVDLFTDNPSRDIRTPYFNLDRDTQWGAYAIRALRDYLLGLLDDRRSVQLV